MIVMNFQEFENLLAQTDIIDSSYPVKGTYVWLPTGFKIKELFFDMIKEKVEKSGYKQYQFPRIMPGRALRKVTKYIANFEDKVFWLRKRDKPLDKYLNPTGECGIYSMFNRWIRTHADLPLKVFQIGSTFRPHRHPYSLLNTDESMSLLEAHGAFASREEAREEFRRVLDLLIDVHDSLSIPYKMVVRPKWGNNPVSEENVSFETYFPPKKVNLNVGVAYYQGQIFSKAFDIKFLTKDRKHDYTHQVTFGINERALAAMFSLHADEYGLQILPEFAPDQVVIIPVYKGENDDLVREYAEKIKKDLYDIRVNVDDSEKLLPREKLPIWRKKGIPLRIGISPKDVKNNTLRVYSRDRKETETISITGLRQKISQYFKEIRSHIYENGEKIFKERLKNASSCEDIARFVDENNIVRFEWCGSDGCGKQIEETSVGEILGSSLYEIPEGECINCGNKAISIAYFAKRAYSP